MTSRRSFLKLTAAALAGLALPRPRAPLLPHSPAPPPDRPSGLLGRALLIYVSIYSRPSVFGRVLARYDRDELIPLYEMVTGEDHNSRPQDWYRCAGGYVYHANIQPVRVSLNPPLARVPEQGQLLEISVPYVDAYRWPPRVVSGGRPAQRDQPRYRLYYATTHWAYGVVFDADRRPWYSLYDDRINETYFVRAEYARPVPAEELAPLSPETPPEQKRLELDTTGMWLTAYEGERLVRQERMAAGAVFKLGEGKVSDYRTPPGEYAIDRKRASRHMAAGDLAADDAYDLPGVPWVSYFNGGIAFHGTYWHNVFGTAQSHGCINLTPEAAKWVYRWSLPAPLPRERLTEGAGTRVLVR